MERCGPTVLEHRQRPTRGRSDCCGVCSDERGTSSFLRCTETCAVPGLLRATHLLIGMSHGHGAASYALLTASLPRVSAAARAAKAATAAAAAARAVAGTQRSRRPGHLRRRVPRTLAQRIPLAGFVSQRAPRQLVALRGGRGRAAGCEKVGGKKQLRARMLSRWIDRWMQTRIFRGLTPQPSARTRRAHRGGGASTHCESRTLPAAASEPRAESAAV